MEMLNRNELKITLKKPILIGHLITDKAIEPDPAKVKAVEKMPRQILYRCHRCEKFPTFCDIFEAMLTRAV